MHFCCNVACCFGAGGVRVSHSIQYFINRMLSIKQQLQSAIVRAVKCPETEPEMDQKFKPRGYRRDCIERKGIRISVER